MKRSEAQTEVAFAGIFFYVMLFSLSMNIGPWWLWWVMLTPMAGLVVVFLGLLVWHGFRAGYLLVTGQVEDDD